MMIQSVVEMAEENCYGLNLLFGHLRFDAISWIKDGPLHFELSLSYLLEMNFWPCYVCIFLKREYVKTTNRPYKQVKHTISSNV